MMNSNSTVALVLKNRDYYTRERVPLGILGGGVPPGSSDFRSKNVISTPVFRPDL